MLDQIKTETIGGLDCRIVDSTESSTAAVDAIVILCHGFGAPGYDLVPVWQEIVKHFSEPPPRVRFVFPAAPIRLDQGGMYESLAWWPIDVVRLQQMIQAGEVRDLRESCPSDLPKRSTSIETIVEHCTRACGLDRSHVVLGGFSQGAMVATDVALRSAQPPGGLIVWSGSLMSEQQWIELADRRGKVQVVQSHGRLDTILPYQGGQWLLDMFRNSGFDVQFISFDGDHTIPADAVSAAAALIERVARLAN